MVKLRKTDFYGTQLDLIDDSDFHLPILIENKLNIYALTNDGYGFIFNSIPMDVQLSIKMGIKLLNKEKFVSRAKETNKKNSHLLYIAENGLRIIIEEDILNLVENSILDWDKLLVVYSIN